MMRHTHRIVVGGVLALSAVVSTAAVLAAPSPRVNVARAQKLFREEGCIDCHKVRGIPGGKTIGPDLSHVGKEHNAAAIAKKIRNPKIDNPNSIMPAPGLSAADLKTLSDWLATLK